MDKKIFKYIKDGITITGNPIKGYEVFTIPTQHFKIKSLDELTPLRFYSEATKQYELNNLQLELFNKRENKQNEKLLINCNFYDSSLGLCSHKNNESHTCSGICVNYED